MAACSVQSESADGVGVSPEQPSIVSVSTLSDAQISGGSLIEVGVAPPSATSSVRLESDNVSSVDSPSFKRSADVGVDEEDFHDASDGSDVDISDFPSQSSSTSSPSIADFSDGSHSLSQSILNQIPDQSSKSNNQSSVNRMAPNAVSVSKEGKVTNVASKVNDNVKVSVAANVAISKENKAANVAFSKENMAANVVAVKGKVIPKDISSSKKVISDKSNDSTGDNVGDSMNTSEGTPKRKSSGSVDVPDASGSSPSVSRLPRSPARRKVAAKGSPTGQRCHVGLPAILSDRPAKP